MTKNGQQVRVGVDIGGTFTDVAMEVGPKLSSTKVLTNYSAPEQAILDGIARVAADAGIAVGDIDVIIHGTTLATNSLIERKGAKTAFLTTKGFRDVIEMRTENRFEQYDLNIVIPPPLIARDHRFVAGGRIAASGREIEPLHEDDVIAFARHLVAKEYESVAIGFVHSYVNRTHEDQARRIIQELAPNVSVSISAEVSPQMREFERFNTVCSNAFVKPLIASYLSRLVERLKDIGARSPVYMIHSGGGLISVETAIRFPVRLLESGPAGGAIYAADVAARHGLNRVLSFDMGGTTAKICLIEDQTPKTARTFEVARTYRFKKGSGMPISVPVIEMVEIGAGGGSIAHVDSMNQVRVGPESAGSEPGPACYQRGGERPTVTDANLVLGRLDPANFAGGEIPLSVSRSQAAMQMAIGETLSVSSETAAISVCEMVDENMTNAARVHAVENGKELADFTMIAYGGGAPLHASRLCEKLGVSELLIPPGAGVGSAIGFLRAPFGYEAVRGAFTRLSQFVPSEINQIIDTLRAEAMGIVSDGSVERELEVECKAYMRYRGQGWEIPVTFESTPFYEDGAEGLRRLFEAEYSRLFGRLMSGLDIEVTNWSVKVVTKQSPGAHVARVSGHVDAESSQIRPIYDPLSEKFLETAIVHRQDMLKGMRVRGPAAIVERETTTIVTESFDAIMQSDGCILLQKKASKNEH
ncbi:hydantoinase/oxoprolinase family protein [Paraburkholderia sp.]|uniref:hydantoinase/oxoprolinase family protein n=1 Tax=Paraburkholderia sp. TaxID=1926495 RepID=UPI003C7A67A4